MQFSEIGQQLRAYRLESGLRAEEIAARLGVSRAALYRYEKGEVIKLDTVKRLAELLKISPLSLLGIGVEYYTRQIGYLERTRQLEETADQILAVSGPLFYLTCSDGLDTLLADMFAEMVQSAPVSADGGIDRAGLRTLADQVSGVLAARRRSHALRRPAIIAIFSAGSIARLLQDGVGSALPLSPRLRIAGRRAAVAEILHLAGLIDSEPMGLQLGLLTGQEPNGHFEVLRARDKASLIINPFGIDLNPATPNGVVMVTGADEAVLAHQRAAEGFWRQASKGAQAAEALRALVGTHGLTGAEA